MKKSIKKKIRGLRSPVLRTAFLPLFTSSRTLFDSIQDLSGLVRTVYGSSLDNKDYLDDIFGLSKRIEARLTTIERWLYVITFALIVALFLLIVLMFI